MNLAGEDMSNKYKPAIWLASSASAEFLADIALCPLEMTKVKIQMSPSGTFPVAFGAALAEMRNRRLETRYPFGSIVPLWFRQVSAFMLSGLPGPTCERSSDTLHHGQILLFRRHRSAILHARLYSAKGVLFQADPTRYLLHLRVSRRRNLRCRLAPR